MELLEAASTEFERVAQALPDESWSRPTCSAMSVHAGDLLRAALLDETLDAQLILELLDAAEPHLDDMLAMGSTALDRAARCLRTRHLRFG